MYNTKRLILMIILSGLISINAFSEPKSGIGLYGGLIQSNMDGELNNKSTSPGTTYSNSSAGFSLGVDYQFAIADFFSINPIWMSSSESISGDADDSVKSVGHGILALQFLFWVGDFFAGGHVGNYSEVLVSEDSDTGNTNTTGGVGPGYGIAIGYKISDKFYTNLQFDNANIEYTDSDQDLQGIRLHVGMRFE